MKGLKGYVYIIGTTRKVGQVVKLFFEYEESNDVTIPEKSCSTHRAVHVRTMTHATVLVQQLPVGQGVKAGSLQRLLGNAGF